jgi:hypothetical protein
MSQTEEPLFEEKDHVYKGTKLTPSNGVSHAAEVIVQK